MVHLYPLPYSFDHVVRSLLWLEFPLPSPSPLTPRCFRCIRSVIKLLQAEYLPFVGQYPELPTIGIREIDDQDADRRDGE